MKPFASLLYAWAAIALVGSATGGPTTEAGGATDCSLLIEEGRSKNETIYELTERCFFQVGYVHMGPNPSDERIRATLGACCEQNAVLRECIERVEAVARSCLDENERTRHRLFDQFAVLDFEIGCEDNGADVAEIYRGTFYGRNKVLKECQANATARMGEIDASDVNAFVVHRYKEMRHTAACLERRKAPGEETNWAITMAAKFLDRVKCFKEGADVPCKTIVADD